MNKYKNYAISGVCHILEKLPEKVSEKINNVILFGSVAQNTANAKSDVDLFFDVDLNKTQRKNLEKLLHKNADDFYLSNKALNYKLEGVDNKINIIVGKLDEWDLKRSIISTGIVLLGRYESSVEKSRMRQNFIISWETPRKNRGAFLNKLYGYSMGKKHYHGMSDKYGCTKVGKSALIVPSEHRLKFTSHMEKYGTGYKIIEIFL